MLPGKNPGTFKKDVRLLEGGVLAGPFSLHKYGDKKNESGSPQESGRSPRGERGLKFVGHQWERGHDLMVMIHVRAHRLGPY